jgi:hypothetical protein
MEKKQSSRISVDLGDLPLLHWDAERADFRSTTKLEKSAALATVLLVSAAVACTIGGAVIGGAYLALRAGARGSEVAIVIKELQPFAVALAVGFLGSAASAAWLWLRKR